MIYIFCKISILVCHYLNCFFALFDDERSSAIFVFFFLSGGCTTPAGAIKEAINTLRSDNVNAFVLDLRDNR